ncbi:MAG: hypothetical protein NC118_15035 [Eubacterium sp.]|nr:hypothetical protein [Eubacterium sp.]
MKMVDYLKKTLKSNSKSCMIYQSDILSEYKGGTYEKATNKKAIAYHIITPVSCHTYGMIERKENGRDYLKKWLSLPIEKELPHLLQAETLLNKCLNEDTTHKYYLLTVEFGIKTYQTYLEWCKEAKKLLATGMYFY